MHNMKNRGFLRNLGVSLAMVAFIAVAGTALAQSSPSGRGFSGVFGKVTAINGTTITITDNRNNTTYTVNASNATVTKNGAASSISGIAAGDTIVVQGTTSGSSVTATKISDGVGTSGNYPNGGKSGSSTRPFNASGTYNRPSGTPPFASGTFPSHSNNFSSSTSSSTPNVQVNSGFFGSITGFFAHILSFFKL